MIDGVAWFVTGVACLVGTLFMFWLHTLYIREWRRELRELDANRRAYDANAQRRHDAVMRASTWYQRAQLGWSKERGNA